MADPLDVIAQLRADAERLMVASREELAQHDYEPAECTLRLAVGTLALLDIAAAVDAWSVTADGDDYLAHDAAVERLESTFDALAHLGSAEQ